MVVRDRFGNKLKPDVSKKDLYFYRYFYIDKRGNNKIGSWCTPLEFTSAARAQAVLELPHRPTHCVKVKIEAGVPFHVGDLQFSHTRPVGKSKYLQVHFNKDRAVFDNSSITKLEP